jgi:hypothetical protein
MFEAERRSRRTLYDRIAQFGKSIVEEDYDYFENNDEKKK